ncbi:MAG: bacteriophage abortive infection AbiH family protein [Clostridia bacterium]|nr:bacteriophage abortive infection AbiH family protein [Clostridia bacterium]
MRTTFLLGNGFDINLGLETSFRKFYDYYLKRDNNNNVIKKFKDDLSENLENWSDLEIALGEYSKNFNKKSEQDFIDLLIDIQDNLAEYLDKQDSDFVLSDSDKKKALDDLINYDVYLTARERKTFLEYRNLGENRISIITFNYTKTFEKIYEWKGTLKAVGSRQIGSGYYKELLEYFEHIHGTTTNNMIMGVNDSSQILNDELKDSINTLRSFVKTEMNFNAGTLRDDSCASAIDKADIICVFGMSFGETDKFWWLKVGERMVKSPSTALVIFNKTKEVIPNRHAYLQEGSKELVKNMFLAHLDLDDTLKSQISKRIFVCLNSKMFKVKLDYTNQPDVLNVVKKLLEAEKKNLKTS